MTITFDAPGQAALASIERGAHWLVELDFAAGTQYLTTYAHDLTTNGHTYLGLGNVAGNVSVSESEDANAETVTLSLSLVNSAMLAATLGNVEGYRGRAARLLIQLIGADFQPVGAPRQRWAGVMDKVQIQRSREGDSASTGRIEMVCSRSGMARSRRVQGLRLSDQQQQQPLRFPGDRGFEYITTLLEKPALWLSKRFQEI